jgi:RNA polymerase sigma factor (sigma-70 family)
MSPWLSELFLSTQSDERLVQLARAGQDRAFAVIVERYRRPLQTFARRLGADGRADDLVQQTFLSAFAALRSGTEVWHLRAWLHQILRHAALRSVSVTTELELDWTDGELATASADELAELNLQARDVLSALATLPSRQHDALVGTAIHGRSRTEVAALMGLSEGAVRQLVHRARENLRGAVTALTPYPVARALAAFRSGPVAGQLPEAAIGAVSASAGGIALKLGALIGSGVVAAGFVSFGSASHPQPPAGNVTGGASVRNVSGRSQAAPRDHGAVAFVSSTRSGGAARRPAQRTRGSGSGSDSSEDRHGGQPSTPSVGGRSDAGAGGGGGGSPTTSGSSGPGPSTASSSGGSDGLDSGPIGTSTRQGPSGSNPGPGSSGSDGGTSGGGSGTSGGGPGTSGGGSGPSGGSQQVASRDGSSLDGTSGSDGGSSSSGISGSGDSSGTSGH